MLSQYPTWMRQRHGTPGGAFVVSVEPVALGLLRALGRKKIPVWTLSTTPTISSFSRYNLRTVPWSHQNDESKIQQLIKTAERHGLKGWALFPSSDSEVALFARHHDRLAEHFQMTVPPWDTVRWALDKRLTYRKAEEIGVACATTYYPGRRSSVQALDCTFPVILKPAIHSNDHNIPSARAWKIQDREELLRRYDELSDVMNPHHIMVQEYLPGDAGSRFSFAAVCRAGIPLASLVARRIRQYPYDFAQFSTYVETTLQPDVEAAARRYLHSLAYTGLAEIEFQRDPKTGTYKLLDFNARAWAWHSLGPPAGVDFIAIFWRLLCGKECAQELRGRPGVRWIRILADSLAAAQLLRHKQVSIQSYLLTLRPPLHEAILALDDPIPGLAEFPLLLLRRRFPERDIAQAALRVLKKSG